MADPGQDTPSRGMEIIAAIVAVVILGTFAVVVVWALVRANDAPMLADPAPKQGNALICVAKNGSSRAAVIRTPKNALARVTCPSGSRLRPAPQARGAYDPNERTIGILAIVAPFVTTIVAFYYGARAGAGEGKAAAARARGREQALASKVEVENRPLYDQLKEQGIIR